MRFDWIGEKIVDEIAEIVLVFNREGEILFVNHAAEKMLDYEKDELLQCSLSYVFRKEFQSEKGEELPFAIEKLQGVEETAMYQKISSCIPVSIRILPTEEEGVYLLMAEDITGRKGTDARIRMLKESEESNRKAQNEFVANVTHEFRTPVNGIKGHVGTLMELVDDQEQRKILDIIMYCCKNMSALIDNILDFSKLEAGKFTIEEQEFDFRQMMDRIVATHTAEISKKELRLSVNVDDKIPANVIGDELRLTQILNNLISNAIKFTHVGYVSIVVSRTRQINDEIELFFMVKDTGIGISEKERDKLFQNFSQADASTTRKFGGTGLGLSISKQLVELMNGHIQVESEKGKGSTFSFYVVLHTKKNYDEDEKYSKVYENWNKFASEETLEEEGSFYQFGQEENREEINKRMGKLILSIEMGAWDKAETLAATVKELAEGAGGDVRRHILRLEMAIRKEDYDKSIKMHETLNQVLTEQFERVKGDVE